MNHKGKPAAALGDRGNNMGKGKRCASESHPKGPIASCNSKSLFFSTPQKKKKKKKFGVGVWVGGAGCWVLVSPQPPHQTQVLGGLGGLGGVGGGGGGGSAGVDIE